MLRPKFGHDIEYFKSLRDLVSRFPRGLQGFKPAVVLREHYEYMHGIAPKASPTQPRPLALVAESPKDGNRRMWMRYRRYHQYRIYGIKEMFNVTLMEFVNLPTADIEWMIEQAQIENTRKLRIAQEEENKRKEQERQKGKAPNAKFY